MLNFLGKKRCSLVFIHKRIHSFEVKVKARLTLDGQCKVLSSRCQGGTFVSLTNVLKQVKILL